MGPLRLAAAQLGPASEHKDDNVARVETLLRQAARSSVEFVVFPELALTPYFANSRDESVASWADDPATSVYVNRIVATAQRAGITCVLPIVEDCEGEFFNSALVIDRDGTIRGIYQKSHLPGRRETREDTRIPSEAGYFCDGRSGFRVFPTSIGKVGVLICADRGYPEAWRVLALAGAQIVATPYNTSVQVPHDESAPDHLTEVRRVQHLRMAASALMNGYVVVAAGKGGLERGVEYAGDSQIIDAWGRIRARASTDGDELVVATVSVEAELTARAVDRQLVRRRPDLYTDLAR